MNNTDVTDEAVGEAVARLEDAHPRWVVWRSDTGFWWASVRDNLTADQERVGCEPHLRADDEDELAELLTEEDTRAEEASPS